MLFKSTKVIGLDIGSSYIKLAELEVSRKGATLQSFGFVPTPKNSLSVRGEVQDPQALALVIQNVIKEMKTKAKSVSTGLFGSAVMVKRITVPKMEEKVLREQLRWEAEQYIPFDINEINLDYALLKKEKSGPESQDLLLIAAQREFLFRLAEVVESAGLSCSIVDVTSFALVNCLQFNMGSKPGEVYAILNVGANFTNFAVVDDDDVVFARDIAVGGNNFTNEIHKQMGISVEEAESLKLSASRPEGGAPAEVADIIRTTIEPVAEEIHRSFDFYSAQAGDASIKKLYITGGGALTPGLSEAISQLTGITAENFNPFQTIGFKPKSFDPAYIQQISPFAAVVLGLGLRTVGDK